MHNFKMKKYTLILIFLCCLMNIASCDSSSDDSDSDYECGTHNGSILYLGPQGGCYYYNSNGNKTYVDRSECNC